MTQALFWKMTPKNVYALYTNKKVQVANDQEKGAIRKRFSLQKPEVGKN